MMRYVFNGCSQTAGKEVLVDRPNADDKVTRNHTWAKHLYELMDKEHNGQFINIARSGASNDSIFRETIEWLGRNPPKEEGDTFMAIMWTEPNRFEFEMLDGFCRDIIAASGEFRSQEEKYLNKFVNEYLANKDLTCKKAYNTMLALGGILDSAGVDYIFLNGFNFSHFYKHYIRQISPFLQLSSYKGKEMLLDDKLSLYQVLTNAGFEHTKFYHFNEAGHKYYAQYVYENLKDIL